MSDSGSLQQLQDDLTALQGDVDIFWLLFGAILVFCESRSCLRCVALLSRALFVLWFGMEEENISTAVVYVRYPTLRNPPLLCVGARAVYRRAER